MRSKLPRFHGSRRAALAAGIALCGCATWLTLSAHANGPAPFAIDPLILVQQVKVTDIELSEDFRDALQWILEVEPSEGRFRKMAIVRPQHETNPLGPGHVDKIRFNFRDAEPIGPVVDLEDGSYAQVFERAHIPEPMVTVTVAGVSTAPIPVDGVPTGPPIPPWVWLGVLVTLASQVLWLVRTGPSAEDPDD